MAKPFHFRLDAVLRVRRQAQERQQRSVAEASRALTAAEDRIDLLTRQMRDNVLDSITEREKTEIDPSALRSGELFRGWLHRKIRDAGADAVEHRRALALRRDSLMHARKDLKAMELLRDRQRRRYEADGQRQERFELDEIALQQYRRRGDEERGGTTA